MEGSCEGTLRGVERETPPLTVQFEFSELVEETVMRVSQKGQIVSIGKSSLCESARVFETGRNSARRGVAMTSRRKPAEAWFHVEVKNERGEGITLNSASTYGNGFGAKARGFLENYPCGGSRIDTLYNRNSVRRKTERGHNSIKCLVMNSVESIGEIDIGEVNIAIVVRASRTPTRRWRWRAVLCSARNPS